MSDNKIHETVHDIYVGLGVMVTRGEMPTQRDELLHVSEKLE